MKILVPTAGSPPAERIAEYVARIAKSLDAEILVIHIHEDPEPFKDGQEALDVMKGAAEASGLRVKSLMKRGPVIETIIEIAERESANLIVMGASKGTMVDQWMSASVLHKSELPVVVIPHAYGED